MNKLRRIVALFQYDWQAALVVYSLGAILGLVVSALLQ